MTYAVDFAIPEGHPIVAAAGGEVMAVTWEMGLPANLNLGDALILYLDHGNGWFTRYVHLDGITVRVGDQVEMGDVIGYGGKTGASGDHLHFELKYGTSLHSPSVPIDELFGGAAPEADSFHTSNNLRLAVRPPTSTRSNSTLPTPSPSPGPLASSASPEMGSAFSSLLPQVDDALTLSASEITVGEPMTATFTLRNNGSERLQLSVLGVGGRTLGAAPTQDSLFFDRAIVLNPGRTYHFSHSYTFKTTGEIELFVFALNNQNEWIPLDGSGQLARLTVQESIRIFLPFVAGSPN
ncbi:MAG: M23 family metallopeptidase [Ardenticatenales bacterium]|nr:M23 family metallopeptidase [Ardenticatenales bacterium]